MKIALFLATVLISISSFAFPITPNPQWTTGEICTRENPDYGGDRYAEKIAYCPRNVSSKTKAQIYDLYKIPKECRSRYTIDHFIPLSIGGDNAPANLWPEHKLVKQTRMSFEEDLFDAVKNGQMTQKEAIEKVVAVKTTLKIVPRGSAPCDQ